MRLRGPDMAMANELARPRRRAHPDQICICLCGSQYWLSIQRDASQEIGSPDPFKCKSFSLKVGLNLLPLRSLHIRLLLIALYASCSHMDDSHFRPSTQHSYSQGEISYSRDVSMRQFSFHSLRASTGKQLVRESMAVAISPDHCVKSEKGPGIYLSHVILQSYFGSPCVRLRRQWTCW